MLFEPKLKNKNNKILNGTKNSKDFLDTININLNYLIEKMNDDEVVEINP